MLRAARYVRESISRRRRGTLSGRPPRGTYEGAIKKCAPPSRSPKKRVREKAARRGGGDVTRRKKDARAKREAVNLGLLYWEIEIRFKKAVARAATMRMNERDGRWPLDYHKSASAIISPRLSDDQACELRRLLPCFVDYAPYEKDRSSTCMGFCIWFTKK